MCNLQLPNLGAVLNFFLIGIWDLEFRDLNGCAVVEHFATGTVELSEAFRE